MKNKQKSREEKKRKPIEVRYKYPEYAYAYIPADAVEEDDEEAMLEWVLEHEDYTAEEIIEVIYPDDYDDNE